ncbi:MAG: hypothetical protein Q9160_003432 [Pyrenula sp. 1 TL-2023]
MLLQSVRQAFHNLLRRQERSEEIALTELKNAVGSTPDIIPDSKPEILPCFNRFSRIQPETISESEAETLTDSDLETLHDNELKRFSERAAEKPMVAHPAPVSDSRPDEVLLIFEGTYDVKRPSGQLEWVYECLNPRGSPICATDIQEFEQVPIAGLAPSVMVAVTRFLQQEEWQDWFVSHQHATDRIYC